MNQWPIILLVQVANIGALVGALCFQNFVRAQRRPAFPRIMRMVAAFTVGFIFFDIIRFRNRAPISGLDFVLVLGSILLMEVVALYLWHRPADGYFQRTIAEQRPEGRQTGFLWQGILILLPVLVLAVAGVWTLRQDRATVESQARNRAESLAATALADIEGFLQQVISAADHGAPVGWTMRTNLSNFILNSRDQLSSPSPLIWPPVPSPLPDDLGTVLKSNKVMQWRLAEEAFAEREWERAAKLYFDFLDRRAEVTSEPMADFYAGIRDRNFRPRALFNRGFAFEQQGATNLAIAAYNDVLDGFNVSHGGVTESGLSLCALAALRVLELAHDDPAQLPEQWQHNPMGLVAMLDNNPSPFDAEIHARIEALGPALLRTSDFHWTPEQLFSRWAESDANRRRYAEAAAQIGKDSPWPSRFWVDGEFPWLAVAQTWPTNAKPAQGEKWIIAFPKTRLEQELAASIRRQGGGEDFAARAEISGRVVGRREEGAFAAHVKSADGNIMLSVSVADAPAFFAAQVRRQWLFGGLLLVAAASCVIGYFAARRAYFRQLRLNEMKSNFVSSVSHELRAPIASVRLMAEGLEGGRVKEPEKQHEYFGFIVQECRRLSSLIENVLDFSRIEQGRKQYEMEPTDFAALVERTVKLMETYAAERQVNITLQKSGEPVAVDLDGKAMQQAIINLVDNALKHSLKGAEITVGLEFARGTNQPCSQEHGHVKLWVEDKGEGIPAVEHERIFERFYRVGSELRRETQGVGIGLSIVKHIVEAHGGKVTVRSAPGEGSRFTIELPLKPQVNESVNQRVSE